MSGSKWKISVVFVLASLFTINAFPQQINKVDSLPGFNTLKVKLRPELHFSTGSTFNFVPHVGSVTGFTLSPSLSIPLSPKWSVDGGIIAGRYYSSFRNFNPEGAMNGAYNALSVYGSARYHLNSQLTLYGIGFKQLSGTSPYNFLPKSSYMLGSTYNFGHFSIGVTFQMSEWNSYCSPFPNNGSHGFYFPFEQEPQGMTMFGP